MALALAIHHDEEVSQAIEDLPAPVSNDELTLEDKIATLDSWGFVPQLRCRVKTNEGTQCLNVATKVNKVNVPCCTISSHGTSNDLFSNPVMMRFIDKREVLQKNARVTTQMESHEVMAPKGRCHAKGKLGRCKNAISSGQFCSISTHNVAEFAEDELIYSCGAQTKAGTPCKLPRMEGQMSCSLHKAKSVAVVEDSSTDESDEELKTQTPPTKKIVKPVVSEGMCMAKTVKGTMCSRKGANIHTDGRNFCSQHLGMAQSGKF